jgi:SPP1 family predicted phage head-tail adaptor
MITIERQGAAPPNDYGEKPDSWATIAKLRASITPIRGKEKMTASGENADTTHKIVARYSEATDAARPRDRVVFGSRVFDIKSIYDVRMGSRAIEIMAIERNRI